MTKRLVLAALLACALPAAAAQPPASKDAPFLIIDNTYYVGQSDPTAFLIKTPAGLVLLDVGYPADAPLVERNIQALGFKLSEVKLLLNSHGHYDHSGGLARLKADTGAKMVSSQGEVYALEKGVYPGSEGSMGFPPVKVDRIVKDGEEVELGGVRFTAHLTPGHTKGCTSWTWPVKDKDGSVHTAIDFCSATVAANRLVPEQYPGMIADYRHTFATAKSIQADVFFAAHSGFFGLATKKARLGQPGPNPFIDRAGFERLLDGQQRAFEAALAAAEKPKP